MQALGIAIRFSTTDFIVHLLFFFHTGFAKRLCISQAFDSKTVYRLIHRKEGVLTTTTIYIYTYLI